MLITHLRYVWFYALIVNLEHLCPAYTIVKNVAHLSWIQWCSKSVKKTSQLKAMSIYFADNFLQKRKPVKNLQTIAHFIRTNQHHYWIHINKHLFVIRHWNIAYTVFKSRNLITSLFLKYWQIILGLIFCLQDWLLLHFKWSPC